MSIVESRKNVCLAEIGALEKEWLRKALSSGKRFAEKGEHAVAGDVAEGG